MVSGVRFAPSPTGRFHLGNLRTAWVAHEFARALGEPWVVRFEDIDTPRVVTGARETQLADLAALGLVPDAIVLQSARRARHYALFVAAVAAGAVYPCFCSRREVQAALAGIASAPHGALPIYTGHCRSLPNPADAAARDGVAWRFRSHDPTGTGDFIVARTVAANPDEASFVPAYHWACAIDDYDGRYRLLVRASDLATSTPLQRAVQAWIAGVEGAAHVPPAVFHPSLVVQDDGHRLEKRTAGVTLAELFAVGWTSGRILEKFRRSFTRPAVPAAGGIADESPSERTLLSLGFSLDPDHAPER